MSNSKNYTKLIIQTSLQEFSFVTKNILTQEYTTLHTEKLQTHIPIEEQLEEIFNKYECLREEYDEILVLHDNALNTFVPQSIFDEKAMGSYLQYTTKVFSTDFFAFDELNLYQMNNVYVPYVNINNFLIDKFGVFVYQNINSILVSHLIEKNINNDEIVVYAYVQKEHFEIIVIKNDQLLLFNSFVYQTPEDFIYYILFVYEQLELNTNITKLTLLGDISESDDYYNIAYKYIKEISIKDINSNIETSILTNNINQHYILLQS